MENNIVMDMLLFLPDISFSWKYAGADGCISEYILHSS